ncbi:MAG: hypothetical protein UT05_C0009G0015 [Parcubacteria group bacterium GW2011_GWF2_38_76]|nr:MAG: hypothetical protein UT05_C0009G0015 [Parcubacteria group bacterium GW2011_GWF2_38_76]
MNKIKILCFVLLVLFGVPMFVYGGYDDSPGGQLLGMVMVITGLWGLAKFLTKTIVIVLIIFIVLSTIGLINFVSNRFGLNEGKTVVQTLAQDYKNATYIIEGQPITLINGVSEIEATPDSKTKIITRYFGNQVKHDLNDDGREDVVFLLTQETGGSGVFFYVVAALNTPTGYVGSQALLLGDRIAPQTTHMDEGITTKGTNRQNVVVVNYAVRLPGEPFTTRPSLGKSIWIKLDPATMQFGEVAQNFEGESR